MSSGEVWWYFNEIDPRTFVPPLDALLNAGLSALDPVGVRHSINDEGVQVPWICS